MPATLGNNLVDELIPVVDDLRGDLFAALGVRQHNVTIVRRVWSGGEVGAGSPAETLTPILPQPAVVFGGEEDRLDACGRVETGTATLREVSLQYTETELMGGAPSPGTEVYYRIDDAHGQGIATTYWVPAKKPTPDRETDLGWAVALKRYEPA